MRVNLATQFMSRTVAAGIYTHAITGLLPQSAIYTAEFFYEVDRLFDCFNNATKFNFKDILGGISSESCHHQFISDIITNYIKSWEVCAPQHVHIHCIDGWLSNLAALKALWQDVQFFRVKYLLTRRLNQDCLENLFAKLRNRSGNCDHPTVHSFMKGLKAVMNNDLLHGPLSGNCEADDLQFLEIDSNCHPDFPLHPTLDDESDTEDPDEAQQVMAIGERNALFYIVGWTCRIFLKMHKCDTCRQLLVDENCKFDKNENFFTHFKAETKAASPFGGLTLARERVLEHFKEVEQLINVHIDKAMLRNEVSHDLLRKFEKHQFRTPLALCHRSLIQKMHLIYIRLKI